MKTVYDGARKRIALGNELAQGGEGTIFLVPGRPELVAKVYHPTKRPPQAKLA